MVTGLGRKSAKYQTVYSTITQVYRIEITMNKVETGKQNSEFRSFASVR